MRCVGGHCKNGVRLVHEGKIVLSERRVTRLTCQIDLRTGRSLNLAGLTCVTCAWINLCLCPFTPSLPTIHKHPSVHPYPSQMSSTLPRGSPEDIQLPSAPFDGIITVDGTVVIVGDVGSRARPIWLSISLQRPRGILPGVTRLVVQ
jgi:hypothetical protein